jgi:hypothetical protein
MTERRGILKLQRLLCEGGGFVFKALDGAIGDFGIADFGFALVSIMKI